MLYNLFNEILDFPTFDKCQCCRHRVKETCQHFQCHIDDADYNITTFLENEGWDYADASKADCPFWEEKCVTRDT